MTAQQRVKQCELRVLLLAQRVATFTGEAQWKNGYRCGKGPAWWNTPEAASIELREQEWWKRASEAAEETAKALAAYRRAILRAAKEAE